jgi:hypothetical protein
MRASGTRLAPLVIACTVACACGSGSNHLSGFPDGGPGGGSSSGTATNTGSSSGGGSLLGDGGARDGAGAGGDCSAASQYVYVVDVNGVLYQFNPPQLAFTEVGTVSCAGDQIFTMAVDRNAVAWVLVQNGAIVKYDINAHTCTPTSFTMDQHAFQTFGMGFSADTSGGSAETLFVSDSELTAPSTGGLADIDTTSLMLTPVHQYDQLTGRRAELTGTGDARLFGAFEGTPYVVAQIDKQTAHIISTAPQNAIDYPPDSSNFAFAFWGGDFWLFVGPGTSTDVFQYQPATNTTTKRTTETFEVVGAGVSTCAPTTPPQ